MLFDKFNNLIFEEEDIFSIIYQGNLDYLNLIQVDKTSAIREFEKNTGIVLNAANTALNHLSISEYDKMQQDEWFMPDEYKQLDIENWILEQCSSVEQIVRVQEELLAFYEKNLINLLRWLKYLVDTCRQHNIIWGVGRGSSTASYCLLLY